MRRACEIQLNSAIEQVSASGDGNQRFQEGGGHAGERSVASERRGRHRGAQDHVDAMVVPDPLGVFLRMGLLVDRGNASGDGGADQAGDGALIDEDRRDAHIQGIRDFYALAAVEPRVSMTAIQTVGIKGYDGFAVALVVEAEVRDNT